MWITPAVLCLCLGLVTSAPAIAEPPNDNAVGDDTAPAEDNAPASSAVGDDTAPAEDNASSAVATDNVVDADDNAVTDDYNYYDYEDDYGDYVAPTAFPFTIFDDVRPRPPTAGDALPSSCAWAVVQCCDNPDPMGSRISCFSHVGCYGAWFQDFCTPKMKKLVFKSVFQSFKFSP